MSVTVLGVLKTSLLFVVFVCLWKKTDCAVSPGETGEGHKLSWVPEEDKKSSSSLCEDRCWGRQEISEGKR